MSPCSGRPGHAGCVTEIVTEGSGEAEAIADRAELSVRFSATGRQRAAAVKALGQQVAAAEPLFELPGVEVASRRLAVHTDWRNNRRVGSVASEDIALRIVDVEVLEDVLDRLIAAEPNNLFGPQWTLSDPSAAVRQAQRQAVADARRRAEGYAEALGSRLGRLLRLSEAAEGPPVVLRTAMAAPAGMAEVDSRQLGLDPEPVRVTVRCTTTWELAQN